MKSSQFPDYKFPNWLEKCSGQKRTAATNRQTKSRQPPTRNHNWQCRVDDWGSGDGDGDRIFKLEVGKRMCRSTYMHVRSVFTLKFHRQLVASDANYTLVVVVALAVAVARTHSFIICHTYICTDNSSCLCTYLFNCKHAFRLPCAAQPPKWPTHTQIHALIGIGARRVETCMTIAAIPANTSKQPAETTTHNWSKQ